MDVCEQLLTGVTDSRTAILSSITIGSVYGIRLVGEKMSPKLNGFLQSDIGGSLLALVTSFGMAVASQGSFSTGALVTAGNIAFTSVGGYSLLKKLILPAFDLVFKKEVPK